MKPTLKPTCILPGCTEVQRARGLCLRHYTHARLAVKRGKVTWHWLESQGWCLPAMRTYVPPISHLWVA